MSDVKFKIEEGGMVRTPSALMEAYEACKKNRAIMLLSSNELERLILHIRGGMR